MRNALLTLAMAVVWAAVGAAVATILWARSDKPEGPCIPIYDQTGLECCQN